MYLIINGNQWHYTDQGSGDPILFLHGLSDDLTNGFLLLKH